MRKILLFGAVAALVGSLLLNVVLVWRGRQPAQTPAQPGTLVVVPPQAARDAWVQALQRQQGEVRQQAVVYVGQTVEFPLLAKDGQRTWQVRIDKIEHPYAVLTEFVGQQSLLNEQGEIVSTGPVNAVNQGDPTGVSTMDANGHGEAWLIDAHALQEGIIEVRVYYRWNLPGR